MLSPRLSRGGLVLVVALLAGYWWMATSTLPRLGLTFDEAGHVASGYAAWQRADYRLNAEDGVLATRVASLPLLGLPVTFPPRDSDDWTQANIHATGYDLFFALGNPFETMLWRARAANALFGVLLLWLIFDWARRSFGRAAGWLALVLAAFSPTLLAQGGLATADMVLTACLFAAVTAWWRLLHRLTWTGVVATGLLSGATLLAKMSGVILVPIVALLVAIRIASGQPWVIALGAKTRRLRERRAIVAHAVGLAAGVGALSFAVLWSGYGFRFAAAEPAGAAPLAFEVSWPEVLGEIVPAPVTVEGQASRLFADAQPHLQPTAVSRTIGWVRSRHLLPEAYLWGFAHTYLTVRQQPSYLLGKVSATGWRAFFPIAFLLKSTPGELLLALAGLGAVFASPWAARGRKLSRSRTGRRAYRLAPLLVLFVVYGLAALSSRLNIGQRHLLPLYPVVFIFGGAAALWLAGPARRIAVAALIILAGWQVVESARARPFYLSYFTPVTGGTEEGWHYLVDSSLDWGQGLPDLKSWLGEKERAGDHAPVFLTYFGWDSPQYRQLNVIRFGDAKFDSGARSFPAPVRGGWFAISATHFARVYLNLAGPWSPPREKLYREIWQSLPRDAAVVQRMSPAEHARFMLDACDLETLQFGRLSYFLQHRPPDALVGASLLLFKVSDEDVRFALLAPLDELTARAEAGTAPRGAPAVP